MTKYIIHVGMMKTGTTALQKAFSYNYDLLLQHKILYPKTAQFQSRHAQLAWSCNDASALGEFAKKNYSGVDATTYLAQIKNEIDQTSPDVCIISGEDFSFGNIQNFQPIVDQLGSNINVVVYVRPQSEMIESMYRQLLKGSGITDQFQPFLKRSLKKGVAGATRLHYMTLVDDWAKLVGTPNITLCVYDEKAKSDIISHFLAAVKLSVPISQQSPRGNLSYEGAYLEILRVANKHLPRNTRHKFVKLLNKFSTSNPVPKKKLLNEKQEQSIMKMFSESNSQLSQKFLNRETLFN